jgi:hypothetical protein
VEPTFVSFGLTGVVLYFGLQNLGLVFTSAGNAALIQVRRPCRGGRSGVLLLGGAAIFAAVLGNRSLGGGVILVSGTDPSGGGDHDGKLRRGADVPATARRRGSLARRDA